MIKLWLKNKKRALKSNRQDGFKTVLQRSKNVVFPKKNNRVIPCPDLDRLNIVSRNSVVGR